MKKYSRGFVDFLFFVGIFAGMSLAAHSERADRDKPMNIDAEQMRIDNAKQTTMASGNVTVTKGSMIIRAAKLDIREDPDGYQFATFSGTVGKPAFFRQKREAVNEYIEGEGDLIEYDGRADSVRFVRNAVLRRLRGTVLADEIFAGQILYENLADRFSAEGDVGKTVDAPKHGRVRIMLTPKPNELSERMMLVQPPPLLREAITLERLPE